jgi:DUF917 family protein
MQLGGDDLDTLAIGATVLGAGGGGPYSLGKQFVAELKQRMAGGKTVTVVGLTDLDSDARPAIPAGIGSPAAAAKGFPLDVVTTAFTKLADHEGTTFDAVLPGEVGAGNSLIPLSVALDLGLPIVDGSGAARAMPSLQMSTFAAQGVPVGTIVLASPQTTVVFEADGAVGATTMSDTTMRDGRAMIQVWVPAACSLCRARSGWPRRPHRCSGGPAALSALSSTSNR